MTTRSDNFPGLSSGIWLVFPLVAALAAGVALVLVGPHHAPSKAPGARVFGEKIVAGGTGNNGCGNGNGSVAACPVNPGKGFSMSGTVEGQIGLGYVRTLMVHVSNPNNQDMQVMTINATVEPPTGAGTDRSKPACTATWVAVSSYSYRPGGVKYIALANKSVDVPLAITLNDLLDTNQDNCRGASFPVTLTGTGQQA